MSQHLFRIIFIMGLVFFITGHDVSADTVSADDYLRQNIIPHTKIISIQDGQELSEKNVAGEIVVNTINYIDWGKIISPQVDFKFQGSQVEKDVPIFIEIQPASNYIKSTAANEQGLWEISIPLSDLPAGKSLASISTKINGSTSAGVSIASFDVQGSNGLTENSYYFAVVILLVIFILLLIIIFQLQKNAAEVSAKKVL